MFTENFGSCCSILLPRYTTELLMLKYSTLASYQPSNYDTYFHAKAVCTVSTVDISGKRNTLITKI